MDPQLRVSLIQSSLFWEDRGRNLAQFSSLIRDVVEPGQVIVLPEMFTTGFSMRPELFAETMDGEAMTWLRQTAASKNAAICGSMMMADDGQFFNRLIWMNANGTWQKYDKRHLFRMGDEPNHYAPGSSRLIVEINGWRIFPLVCYDLRFPVWLRRTKEFDYDVMVLVANWPERRAQHWKTLLQARAIENQCYVIGVNRVGADGNEVKHSGDSSVISPKGEILFQQQDEACVHSFTLGKEEIAGWRTTFPVIEDADLFNLI